MADKPKVIKGTAKWAKVFTPETKFNPNGVYSIHVVKEEVESQPFIDFLEKLVEEKSREVLEETPRLKGKLSTKLPFDEEYDKDDVPTGNLEFKIKQNASGTTKAGEEWERSIPVVDSKRTPMDESTLVGNGSTVKVAFHANPYYIPAHKTVGVTLKLVAVQVLELVEYSKGGGVSSIFDEEDGFEVEKSLADEVFTKAEIKVKPSDLDEDEDEDDGDF